MLKKANADNNSSVDNMAIILQASSKVTVTAVNTVLLTDGLIIQFCAPYM